MQLHMYISDLYGDRNLGSEMAGYEAATKLAGWSPGNDDEVSFHIN